MTLLLIDHFIWFPKMGVPPSHHPFLDGIFHEINQPAIGYPHGYGNPFHHEPTMNQVLMNHPRFSQKTPSRPQPLASSNRRVRPGPQGTNALRVRRLPGTPGTSFWLGKMLKKLLRIILLEDFLVRRSNQNPIKNGGKICKVSRTIVMGNFPRVSLKILSSGIIPF